MTQEDNFFFNMIEINKIYNIDCLYGMKMLEDKSIDLIVTSPPYDNLRAYNNNIDKNWNESTWKPIIKEMFRIMKDGGIVVWIVNDATINGSETGTSFKQALHFMDCGFKLHDTMIYNKVNPVPSSHNRYQQTFEYMFVFSKGKPKTTNILLEKRHNECNDKRTVRIKRTNRDKNGEFGQPKLVNIKEMVPRRNIWTYKVGLYNSTSDKNAFQHPAIFPEKLVEDHILSWSNEGDLILDTFIGSGTTAKMSILNKRNFIGFEINEEYYNIALDRIKNLIKKDE